MATEITEKAGEIDLDVSFSSVSSVANVLRSLEIALTGCRVVLLRLCI